jgi:hypothetical protein
MAVYPGKGDNVINREFLNKTKNRLESIFPEDGKWSDVIRVIDNSNSEHKQDLYLNVNTVEQKGILYLDKKDAENKEN